MSAWMPTGGRTGMGSVWSLRKGTRGQSALRRFPRAQCPRELFPLGVARKGFFVHSVGDCLQLGDHCWKLDSFFLTQQPRVMPAPSAGFFEIPSSFSSLLKRGCHNHKHCIFGRWLLSARKMTGLTSKDHCSY